MKILIVDDEKATESLFKQQFKEEIKEGLFEFNYVPSGEEALKYIGTENHPGTVLILSDINMPGMSGLQLLKQLKAQFPSLPVMMVTAYGDEVNHKKAMAYNADGFVNKPIDFAALKDKILKFLPKKAREEKPAEKSKTVAATKIMVVDDEPALEALIRQKFRTQIKEGEMEFSFASNGVEALEILDRDEEIGIVLTDINMPEMDGLTLLAKLRERKNRIFRSIVISAYGDMENIRTAMNLGASDFITKPIDLRDLATTLNKVIEQYHALQRGVDAEQHLIAVKKELEIATNIQKTLMPQNFTPFQSEEKVELFAKIFPANEVGGDFYDFFPIGDHKLGFVIADVSGKGIPAALFMAMSKTLLRSTALATNSIKDCMREVGHFLCYNNDSMMFVTAFYAVLDINSGELTFSNAGHIPPYILSKEGTMTQLPKIKGIALGIDDDLKRKDSLYEEKSIQLQAGDTVILFTDGVIEAINPEQDIYPRSRFEEVIRADGRKELSSFIHSVKEDVDTFAKEMDQFDDITLFSLRWKG